MSDPTFADPAVEALFEAYSPRLRAPLLRLRQIFVPVEVLTAQGHEQVPRLQLAAVCRNPGELAVGTRQLSGQRACQFGKAHGTHHDFALRWMASRA